MLPAKEMSRGGAHAALMCNAEAHASAVPPNPLPLKPEPCGFCGLTRRAFSQIRVDCVEGRVEFIGLCGACTRRLSK
jgi:hypothetical protein